MKAILEQNIKKLKIDFIYKEKKVPSLSRDFSVCCCALCVASPAQQPSSSRRKNSFSFRDSKTSVYYCGKSIICARDSKGA
jgi:hypothetical protein